jgi:hypothetical protein
MSDFAWVSVIRRALRRAMELNVLRDWLVFFGDRGGIWDKELINRSVIRFTFSPFVQLN